MLSLIKSVCFDIRFSYSFIVKSISSLLVIFSTYFLVRVLLSTIFISVIHLLQKNVQLYESATVNEFSLSANCGTFNQEYRKLGEIAGKECACISLFSTIFLQLKEIGKWESSNLNLILVCGDKTYKNLALSRILAVEDF